MFKVIIEGEETMAASRKAAEDYARAVLEEADGAISIAHIVSPRGFPVGIVKWKRSHDDDGGWVVVL